MSASLLYSRTIQSLTDLCKSENVKGDMTLATFCAKHSVSRQNLTDILQGHQDISVALFLRLAAILTNKPEPVLPAGVERWSLRTWLEMQQLDVHGSMYAVNFHPNL